MKRILVLLFIPWLLTNYFLSIQTPVDAFAQVNADYEIEDDVDMAEEEEVGLVSLDFKDADLKDVLKVFSQQSGLNFVAAKNIEDRTITLYMNDVLVEDALKTLLEANNLGLEQSPGSNILIVKAKPTLPIETVTRVYKIRYYHGNSSPGMYLLDSKSSGEKDTGGGMSDIIRPLLSEYGVVIDFTNLLIITDVPDRFKLIDQVISEIDKPIPEVMLEVELIETTSDYLKQLGMKWSDTMMELTQGAQQITNFPFFTNDLGRGRKAPGFAALETPLDTDGAFFRYGLISASLMKWTLQMLQTDTNTKFLAKPRILVQDREWAEIRITSDQIVSLITIEDSESGDVTTKVERAEVGTILRLVPIINADEGYVSILLEPSISRPIDSAFQSVDGQTFVDPNFRSMRTVVMSRDGETIAVGGFITTEDEEVKTKVPWLGDIPLLGALFRHSKNDRIDKELLIFVTPRIVNPSKRAELWMNNAQAAEQNSVSQREQASLGEETTLSEQKQEDQEVSSGPKTNISTNKSKQETVEDLPFREQEELSDLNIDLTMQSSSLSTVDLIK
jgi:type II secretory pathway component GspD/PulD (secretin)